MSTSEHENKILIATPSVTGKFFNKSVIHVHTADDTGASGVMLNFPMDYDTAVMWSNEIGWQYPNAVYQGGPIERRLGYVIHSSDYARETSIRLNSELSYTGGRAIIDDINRGVGPLKFQLSSGYCQWDPHQLQTEIDHGMWLVTDFDVDYFFQDLGREYGWEFAINVAAENRTKTLLNFVDIT
jgi:putative transcriptional regulator|tara:strand:+ start:501 stop:1052 length:552 start_codon:yes stop_codon:yes gene_type:complete